jgi:nitrogen regulatory protein PII
MQAIIRPWRLDPVVAALAEKGIVAVTSTSVRGAGAQGGSIQFINTNCPQMTGFKYKPTASALEPILSARSHIESMLH